MKKILMTIVAAFVATTMSAQDMWVGGSLGFTSTHKQGNTYSNQTITVIPEVGFNLDENMDIAIALGYTHNKYTSSNCKNTFVINPYLRYKFVKVGNFSAFADCGIQYSTAHTRGYKENTNNFGAAIVPGIAYAISDKVTLVSHLGDGLYFNHGWNKGFEGDSDYPAQSASHTNSLGFTLFNGVTFGAYISL